jgi:hypothetical protein
VANIAGGTALKSIGLIVLGSLLFCACGSTGPSSQFIGTLDYLFRTDIRAETLTQQPNQVAAVFEETGEQQYLIASKADLDAFNTALPSAHLTLSELDTYAYFFIRILSCPFYDELADTSYSNGTLRISRNRFKRVNQNPTCAPLPGSTYDVFRAQHALIKKLELSFSVAVQPETLEQQSELFLPTGGERPEDRYLINNETDLDAFNHARLPADSVSLNELQTYAYFLLRVPACSYYVYTGHAYQDGVLTIRLNHIDPQTGLGCAAVIQENYYVFRARR